MKPTYRLNKGHDGWRAETETELGTDPEKNLPRILAITTSKINGTLLTRAMVYVRDRGFQTYKVYWDFHLNMERTTKRCTEKIVEAQHVANLEQIEQVKAAAIEHYLVKDAEKVAAKAEVPA